MMTRKSNNTVRRAASVLVMFALILVAVIPASAQRRRARTRRAAPRVARVTTPPVRFFTVPADTVIRVRMDSQMSSRSARVGDRFSATVTEPVYGGESGLEVVPVGSKIWGRVTSVKQAGRRSPGNISVSFYQIATPSRATYPINGSLSSLQADDVNADNEGTVAGKSNRKRDAVFIGGGAATGAIIGAIAGGGKGAAIGAIVGAAGGAGSVYVQGREDIELLSGTELTIRASAPNR